MSFKLIITIDTEEDSWGEWEQRNNAVENVSRIPILQRIFDRYKAFPTYLVTYPVATNENAITILRDIISTGRGEIGTHCHPWNTPPFDEEKNAKNSMLCNLEYELVYKKLEHLHKTIIDAFEAMPICFRAGRWGFGAPVAKALCELSYKVDTSVTPFIDWRQEGGPDYFTASPFPYRFEPENILLKKNDGRLCEIPCTIGFLQGDFRRSNKLRNRILKSPLKRLKILGILDRLKILNLRWLSPELSNASEMIDLAKRFFYAGHRLLNLSFHSTSLLPGKSPFVRNEAELQKFLKCIEQFLQFCLHENVEFSGLSEVSSYKAEFDA